MTAGGIVLCGGRSSRMGRPKAWLPFGDELLLQRVVRVVGGAVGPVVVVAAPGQDVPPLPAAVRVVRDEEEGRGPLAGLVAGLAALEGSADAAYLSACDAPFLTPAFVDRMVSFLAGGGLTPPARPDIAVPHVGGHHHPVAAVYRLDLLPVARRLLAAGAGPVALFDAAPTLVIWDREVAEFDPEFRSLWNLNYPEEYAAALRELGGPPPTMPP